MNSKIVETYFKLLQFNELSKIQSLFLISASSHLAYFLSYYLIFVYLLLMRPINQHMCRLLSIDNDIMQFDTLTEANLWFSDSLLRKKHTAIKEFSFLTLL